jgi:hypothetical protein
MVFQGCMSYTISSTGPSREEHCLVDAPKMSRPVPLACLHLRSLGSLIAPVQPLQGRFVLSEVRGVLALAIALDTERVGRHILTVLKVSGVFAGQSKVHVSANNQPEVSKLSKVTHMFASLIE